MDLNLHLQNLPRLATNVDIRRFFGGLEIPEGGVQIIGGKDGDAFITFTLEEDLLKALMFDKEPLLGQFVNLYLAREVDIERVIEKRGKEIEVARRKNREYPGERKASMEDPERSHPSSGVSMDGKDPYDQLQEIGRNLLEDRSSDTHRHQLRKRSPDHRSSSDRSKKRKEEEVFDMSLPFHTLAVQRNEGKKQGHHSESSASASLRAGVPGHSSEDRPQEVAPWLRGHSPSWGVDTEKGRDGRDKRHGSERGQDEREGRTSRKSRDRHSGYGSDSEWHSRGSRHRHDSRERHDRSSRDRHDRGSSRDRHEHSGSRERTGRDGRERSRDRSDSRDSRRDRRAEETAERGRYSESRSKHSRYPLEHFAVYDLDVTVTATDLRKFFVGHRIPEGGIVLKSDPRHTNALIAYIACYPQEDGSSAKHLSGLTLHTRQVAVKLIPESLYQEHKLPTDRLNATLMHPPPNYNPYLAPPPQMWQMWRHPFPQAYGMPHMGYGMPHPGYGAPPGYGHPGIYPPHPGVQTQRSLPTVKPLHYLRLEKLDKDITAYKIWRSLGAEEGSSKNVTLICDPHRDASFAYVAYENKDARNAELDRRDVSEARARSYHVMMEELHNLDLGWTVTESMRYGIRDITRDFVGKKEPYRASRDRRSPERRTHGEDEKRTRDGRRRGDRGEHAYYDTKRHKSLKADRYDRHGSGRDKATRKRSESESSISSTLSESPVSDFSGSEEEEDDTIHVYACNFPLTISEREVEDYFKQFNPIANSARIEWGDESQFASIRFKLDKDADAAVIALNEKMYTPSDKTQEERVMKVYRAEVKNVKKSRDGSSNKSDAKLDKRTGDSKAGDKKSDRNSAKESNKKSDKHSSKRSYKSSSKHSDKRSRASQSSRKSDKLADKTAEKKSDTKLDDKSNDQSEKRLATKPDELSEKGAGIESVKQVERHSDNGVAGQGDSDKADSHANKPSDDSDVDIYDNLDEPTESDKQEEVSLDTSDILLDLDMDKPDNDLDNQLGGNCDDRVDNEGDMLSEGGLNRRLENNCDKGSTADVGKELDDGVHNPPENDSDKLGNTAVDDSSEQEPNDDSEPQLDDDQHVDDVEDGGSDSDIDIYAEIDEQPDKEMDPSLDSDFINEVEAGLDV